LDYAQLTQVTETRLGNSSCLQMLVQQTVRHSAKSCGHEIKL